MLVPAAVTVLVTAAGGDGCIGDGDGGADGNGGGANGCCDNGGDGGEHGR
jgi:hypothetical protein